MVPTHVVDALAAIVAGATAADRESDTLDFKREGRSREDAMRTVAQAAMCFANARGGVIVLGVQDRTPGVAAFEGTDIATAVLARRIYELTDPSLTLAVEEHHQAGRRLLVVTVPASADVH